MNDKQQYPERFPLSNATHKTCQLFDARWRWWGFQGLIKLAEGEGFDRPERVSELDWKNCNRDHGGCTEGDCAFEREGVRAVMLRETGWEFQ